MYAGEYQTKERMDKKLKAIPLPNLEGLNVLDVGCDHGFWCWHSVMQGASSVVGLDRNRTVKGQGPVDLITRNQQYASENKHPCQFYNINLGQQWWMFGRFDVIYMFSMYHHVFEQCGDHESIWFWLWEHCYTTKSIVLWENPTDPTDSVVQRNVSKDKHALYNEAAIMNSMSKYFLFKYIGSALHEDTRSVWKLTPKDLVQQNWKATVKKGAGGASKAFEYADGRRMKEFKHILGTEPYPGSLNLELVEPFDWDSRYYRAQILDVVNRKAGLDSPWAPRWARIYPVKINGTRAYAFRFEGEKYPDNFVELIAPIRLRKSVQKTVRIVK